MFETRQTDPKPAPFLSTRPSQYLPAQSNSKPPNLATLCAYSKNATRRRVTSVLVVKCYWLLCVTWLIASFYRTGVCFWMRYECVNGTGLFSAIKTLCFTLFDIVWLQKTCNAIQLVCNAFILLVYGQFLQWIPVTALIFACYMFYTWWWMRRYPFQCRALWVLRKSEKRYINVINSLLLFILFINGKV